ncbi:MAG: flavodoxin family protein [Clostridiales bacterium]|nr:flavodoxin family protein [Clostridiales bacterium]
MNVLLLNGSPRTHGCTARALKEVALTLNAEGIETETVSIASSDIPGCISCGSCKKNGKCVFDDIVNELATKLQNADGFIVGTPVYYAGCNGSVLSLLDRLFHSTGFDKTMKVGACVISSRRAGSTSAFDEINKYFTICNMPIVSSSYWNEVHGSTAEDVEKDVEGLQTMRNLARNMAFMIKSIRLGKEKFGLPKNEFGACTNFLG